jgi:membrane associated rhomboid family serine protease
MFTPEQNGSFKVRAVVLFVLIAVMWIVRAASAVIPGHLLSSGIVPRDVSSLVGILTAPFVHVSFRHLIANSIPLFVLGTLVLLRGLTEFAIVIQLSILIGGAGTWLFGTSGSQHVGASGIVLGLMGYLLIRAAFDRKISSIVITLVVALVYGTTFAFSLIPQQDISWSGHFFGLLGGITAARLLARRGSSERQRANAEALFTVLDIQKRNS